MAAAIPAGPLVTLAGLFVITALTYAGLREGAWPAFVVAGASLAFFGLVWFLGRIAWRGLRAQPILSPGLILFAGMLFTLNAMTTLAFCGSMSV